MHVYICIHMYMYTYVYICICIYIYSAPKDRKVNLHFFDADLLFYLFGNDYTDLVSHGSQNWGHPWTQRKVSLPQNLRSDLGQQLSVITEVTRTHAAKGCNGRQRQKDTAICCFGGSWLMLLLDGYS